MSRAWPEGVVVRDGHPVFLCTCVKDCPGCCRTPCGRQQGYAPPHASGGVTPEEARQLGWVRTVAGPWLCPFCTGQGKTPAIPAIKRKKGRS